MQLFSDIFCHGPLLAAVQNAKLFPDSKYFVDMALRYDPVNLLGVTMQAFRQLSDPTNVQQLKTFVDEYFLPPGSELAHCYPSDWKPYPASLETIKDPNYRLWAFDVNSKWTKLCRRVKDMVRKNPQLYSLISVPHSFIIPGGRFKEYYYWDSYWIIKGLLASEMIGSAKNMIRNLADMIRRFGFVPNGGRIYYLNRSQPPVLTMALYDYFLQTGDLNLVKEILPLLDQEMAFWKRNRTVQYRTDDNEVLDLFQYRVHVTYPRPESYREDEITASILHSKKAKEQLWSNIASACESGWDFSSRWIDMNFGPVDMHNMRTTEVVPADLNAIICGNNHKLGFLHKVVGEEAAARQYEREFEAFKSKFYKAFWDPLDGTWYDLNLERRRRIGLFYASNIVPLFTECTHDQTNLTEVIVEYLRRTRATDVPHGFPTSFIPSMQQWDDPNGWAPLNHMAVIGLSHSKSREAQQVAFEIAKKWLETNYMVWISRRGDMFEKYNVETLGYGVGIGGEYVVQTGFGWTNGVVLDLLLKYSDVLMAPDRPTYN
ncbi:unnamed protein product [Soboliphyme baturini]|uniref:Trehalase n=1 Tax=Soboliphyme baturini TaxID=241478 RepID=A0A183IMK7_9BILA|nr:unnamed protein product [Soboliphyme baturini]